MVAHPEVKTEGGQNSAYCLLGNQTAVLIERRFIVYLNIKPPRRFIIYLVFVLVRNTAIT